MSRLPSGSGSTALILVALVGVLVWGPAACSIVEPQTAILIPLANSEFAPLSAQQVAAEIEHTKAVTPLPPGATWQQVDLPPADSYGEGSGRSQIEFQALCRWLETAMATRREDPLRSHVEVVLAGIPSWRTFSNRDKGDGTMQSMIQHLVDAAISDESTAPERFITVNCAG